MTMISMKSVKITRGTIPSRLALLNGFHQVRTKIVSADRTDEIEIVLRRNNEPKNTTNNTSQAEKAYAMMIPDADATAFPPRKPANTG